ncbi:MAG: ABC transporter permease, partial [Candidatus Latescibacteria bacterium]|nr:ABC transporter permease [Candidatus Latescibacterota bacterium]
MTSLVLTFDFVVNRHVITTKWVEDSWTTGDHFYLFIRTFIRLAPGATQERLRKKLDTFAVGQLGVDVAEREPYGLLPMGRLYLYGHHDFRMFNAKIDSGDIYQCYAFALVGGFLLLIACINFVNLSTARAEDRALEVGVRKAVGATRVQLAGQFLVESFALSICAAVLAMGLVALMLPWANGLLLSKLELNAWSWGFCAIMTAFTGLVAGAYPAFLLSSFHPALVLKGSRSISSGRSYLRRGLVVSQFAIAVVLIVVTLTVKAQMQYVHTRDLGFRREGLLILPFFTVKDPALFDQYDTIRARFLALPDVVGYTASSYLPGKTNFGDLMSVARAGQTDSVDVYEMSVDHNFTTVYDIPIVEGRGFREQDRGLTTYLLVNQTAARLLNGLEVGDEIRADRKSFQVVGIVEDFFYNSLYSPMVPLVLVYWFGNYNYVSLDVRTENLQDTIASLESLWKEYIPSRPLKFQFIDDRLAGFYREEHRTHEVFVAMSILTIFVACLGLLGLIAHAVRVRTKEIGVRKVLGASVTQIV